MHPVLGQEMAAARMGDMQRRMQHTAQVKVALGAKRRSAKQISPPQIRLVPAGAFRLGRAIRRLRSKPDQQVACC
jgi:hypothetical protein